MNPQTSHTIKHRASPKDVFYTPASVAKTHIQSIVTEPDDIWFDPFKGKGIYYDNFPTETKIWTEITEGKDFFSSSYSADVICSNPPYSCIDEVLKKSVEINPRVLSYLLLEGKMTPKRIEYLNQNGYGMTGMYICKVFQWYGMAVAYTFTKGAQNQPTLIYDRVVHRE